MSPNIGTLLVVIDVSCCISPLITMGFPEEVLTWVFTIRSEVGGRLSDVLVEVPFLERVDAIFIVTISSPETHPVTSRNNPVEISLVIPVC